MKRRISHLFLALVLLAAIPLQAATLSAEQQAVHVLNRITYGPKPGDIERVMQMGVQRYVETQLQPQAIPYPDELAQRLRALDTPNRTAGQVLGEYNELRREVRGEDEGARQRRRAGLDRIARETAAARLLRAIDSPRQLEEVMVDFWFNHFNVFSGEGMIVALVASYERDAIRPYALGSFRELLGATAHHPAMLVYFDNYLSTSSESGAAGRTRGLNENYARALMELHTLGVDGGYTQKDVTELARMLTGWTFNPRRLVREDETFAYDPKRHDNGAKTWLGRAIAPEGYKEGQLALDVLAVHPATARHVSYKLAQYFVSDVPPRALVERMARTWLETRGDIRAVLRVLLTSEKFMAPAAAGAKFKTPYRFVISAVRASGTPVKNVAPLVGALDQMGMPLYGCRAPGGYRNTRDAWFDPAAPGRRIAFASALASGRMGLAAAPAQAVPPATSSAALPMRAAPATGDIPPMGTVAPAVPPPSVTATVSSSAMEAARARMPLDPARLQATLGSGISQRTRETVARNPVELRAAMLLGSADFMQH